MVNPTSVKQQQPQCLFYLSIPSIHGGDDVHGGDVHGGDGDVPNLPNPSLPNPSPCEVEGQVVPQGGVLPGGQEKVQVWVRPTPRRPSTPTHSIQSETVNIMS